MSSGGKTKRRTRPEFRACLKLLLPFAGFDCDTEDYFPKSIYTNRICGPICLKPDPAPDSSWLTNDYNGCDNLFVNQEVP